MKKRKKNFKKIIISNKWEKKLYFAFIELWLLGVLKPFVSGWELIKECFEITSLTESDLARSKADSALFFFKESWINNNN